jgi:hypothetical protein
MSDQPDPLADLRLALASISQDELIAELKRMEPVRSAALEKRLAPFRTPVTDATMRRGR